MKSYVVLLCCFFCLESALILADTFWLLGIISFILAAVTVAFLPETNIMSSKEVLKYFEK